MIWHAGRRQTEPTCSPWLPIERGNMNAEIVEKDFWVCWVLRRLFTLTNAPAGMIFKGGTSLSKVFNAIGRFSEDVDLSFDRADLGFGGDNDPGRAPSKKQTKQRLKMLKEACQTVIRNRFLPQLAGAIGEALNDPGQRSWKLEIDQEDLDGQTVLFHYATGFATPGPLPLRRKSCGPSERTRRPCGRISRRIIEVANRHEQRSAQGLRHLGSKSRPTSGPARMGPGDSAPARPRSGRPCPPHKGCR